MLQEQTTRSRPLYTVIDALDECEKDERDNVLNTLSSVIASPRSIIKMFIASRESIDLEIKRRFSFTHASMASPVNSEITRYAKEVVDERLSNGEPVVGDEGIVAEIQNALIQGAQGM